MAAPADLDLYNRFNELVDGIADPIIEELEAAIDAGGKVPCITDHIARSNLWDKIITAIKATIIDWHLFGSGVPIVLDPQLDGGYQPIHGLVEKLGQTYVAEVEALGYNAAVELLAVYVQALVWSTIENTKYDV